MTDTSIAASASNTAAGQWRGSAWRNPMAALFFRILRNISVGHLSVTTPDGETIEFGRTGEHPSASLTLNSWSAARRMLFGGDVAFGEAYMDGLWDSPDLPAVVELAGRNIDRLDDGLRSPWMSRWRNRVIHLMNANTRRGSRRNIMRHYDLGNDFYRQWLDDGMNYSSGIFRSHGASLSDGQDAKNDRILDLLGLDHGASVLEIGSGWGALAERLVGRHGARYTGLTLSPAQKAYAEARLAGFRHPECQFRLEDYRDCQGSFDRIASVEMIEAVGEEHWPAYFRTLADRLKKNGCAVVQAITIAEHRYDGYRNCVDFIQKHVFPGGTLPTITHIREHAGKAGLKVDHEERFGMSYAETLAEWHRRFDAAWPSIKPLGFDERFRRLWKYYLAYCEGGFRAGTIDVGLYRLAHA